MIYLDHNATTAPCDAAMAAVETAIRDAWHNPSSVHRGGQVARRLVERARAQVAALCGVKASEVTFTSGATEAIDLAHRGVVASLPPDRRTLITTAIEHEAVREVCDSLHRDLGAEVLHAPIDADGVVNADAIAEMIDARAAERAPSLDLDDAGQLARAGAAAGVALVSVQWANNETGAIQPVADIGRICRQRGVLFFCDATQWIGKMHTAVLRPSMTGAIDTDSPLPWIDMMCCSGHKFHGIKGAGALIARRGVGLRPQLLGAQEKGRRGGTEAVPAIAALGAAAEHAAAWLASADAADASQSAQTTDRPFDRDATPAAARNPEMLRDRLERGVLDAAPGAVVNASDATRGRLWNTTNIGFPGLEAEALLLLLSERGVAASAGAACSSGSLDPSPILLAMGVPEHIAHGSIRLSLSRDTTIDEIDSAAPIIASAVERLSGTTARRAGEPSNA
jgi:cysteine desulfurase